jgi:uncharacterized membrane protein
VELNKPDRSISVVTYFYAAPADAIDVLRRLREAHELPGVTEADVLSAAVMSASATGTLKLDAAIQLGDIAGGDIQTIFPLQILALKAVGSDALKAAEHFEALGFNANLLKEIGENLPAGGAALVLIIAEPWTEELRQIVGAPEAVERYALASGAPLGTARGGNR